MPVGDRKQPFVTHLLFVLFDVDRATTTRQPTRNSFFGSDTLQNTQQKYNWDDGNVWLLCTWCLGGRIRIQLLQKQCCVVLLNIFSCFVKFGGITCINQPETAYTCVKKYAKNDGNGWLLISSIFRPQNELLSRPWWCWCVRLGSNRKRDDELPQENASAGYQPIIYRP